MDGFLLLIIPYEQLVKFILTIFFNYHYIFLNRAKISY